MATGRHGPRRESAPDVGRPGRDRRVAEPSRLPARLAWPGHRPSSPTEALPRKIRVSKATMAASLPCRGPTVPPHDALGPAVLPPLLPTFPPSLLPSFSPPPPPSPSLSCATALLPPLPLDGSPTSPAASLLLQAARKRRADGVAASSDPASAGGVSGGAARLDAQLANARLERRLAAVRAPDAMRTSLPPSLSSPSLSLLPLSSNPPLTSSLYLPPPSLSLPLARSLSLPRPAAQCVTASLGRWTWLSWRRTPSLPPSKPRYAPSSSRAPPSRGPDSDPPPSQSRLALSRAGLQQARAWPRGRRPHRRRREQRSFAGH